MPERRELRRRPRGPDIAIVRMCPKRNHAQRRALTEHHRRTEAEETKEPDHAWIISLQKKSPPRVRRASRDLLQLQCLRSCLLRIVDDRDHADRFSGLLAAKNHERVHLAGL